MESCEACKALAARVAQLEQLISMMDERLAAAEWQRSGEFEPALAGMYTVGVVENDDARNE